MNAQRMTEEETQAVIRLWQAEQPGVADPPTLSDVAEGLDISVADAQRLLSQVRARRAEEERLLAQEQAAFDLEQARLREEQDLAEVRRRRAKLRRQPAQPEPGHFDYASAPVIRDEVYTAKVARSEIYTAKIEMYGTASRLILVLMAAAMIFFLVSLFPAKSSSPASGGLAPCYINNNPAPAADCQAINSGDYAPLSDPEYQHDPNKR